MIKAVLFDLDGTLVQTEKLKALSNAMAVQRIRGLPAPDDRAIEATGRSWAPAGTWPPAMS